MFEDKVLVVKLAAVDGLAAGPVVVGEVTSLAHELGDDAVEAAPLEAEALFMRAQAAEVLYKRATGKKRLKNTGKHLFHQRHSDSFI